VSWTVIIPVKRLGLAKSRLRGAVPGVDHGALVLAMAMDTVAAALDSPVVGRVVVVTADDDVTEAARGIGAEVVDDLPDAGLNPALAYAATVARPRGAIAGLPGVAALTADLPALRTVDLTAALRAAQASTTAGSPARGAPERAYVPDAVGTGTVLLAASPGAGLEPCFGAGSAAAHAASGAVGLTGSWPSLRRDVDTGPDLAEAVALGVGPRTAAVFTPVVATPLAPLVVVTPVAPSVGTPVGSSAGTPVGPSVVPPVKARVRAAAGEDGSHAGHRGLVRYAAAPWLAAARRWLRTGLFR
jgi:2-phospho-L-lactate/phosphoenolpyruvate guanylyltransferase